jgi:murein DD-endopeptidase MepM/ murein hydrolase activator NlpD
MYGIHSLICAMAILLLCCTDVRARKNNISTGVAKRELGVVAAFQGFPYRVRLDRAGYLKVDESYFHIFYSEMRETKRWRTLVFDNSAAYLGYFETADQLAGLEKDGLIFPGEDYSTESGDEVEGEVDSGTAHIIRFGQTGPPDRVKFGDKTYTFVSSPNRVRPEDPAYRFLRTANRVAEVVNQGRFKHIREDFSESALERISEEQTEIILSGVREKLGRIKNVEAPWFQTPNTAILPIIFERTVAGLKLTLDEEDKIQGIWMLPFETAFPEIGTNRVPMRLPFKGKWRLMWGGGQRGQSKYFGSRVSHNALEFVISSRFNKTFRREGEMNRDYYAYGQPVLAPAAGTVVAVVNGIPDNQPGEPNPFDRLGNAIMIQHSTNEFCVVGHLMQNSITVAPGERVVAGLPIARCGNSGDSLQPSIYFHLQDSGDILSGSGYRPMFSNLYVWRGKDMDIEPAYSPVRGDFIQQRSARVKTVPPRQVADTKSVSQGLGDVEETTPDTKYTRLKIRPINE